MEIKYTKINLLYEQNNDMCHNFYFIYYGKIINDEHTRCRKFKYVEWFDIFDVQDFFEKDWVTKEDIREYALNIENSYLLAIKNYDDTKHIKEFYDFCRESIENYNKVL